MPTPITLFPLRFRRQQAESIDEDAVFLTTAERISYLTNPRRYGGQIVSDLQDEKVYVLNAARNAWLPIGGSGPLQLPYDFQFQIFGINAAGRRCGLNLVPRAMKLAADWGVSAARTLVPPSTGSSVFHVLLNGVQIGSFSFAVGQTNAVVTPVGSAERTLAPGDILSVETGSAGQYDTSIQDVIFYLAASMQLE